MPHNSHLIPTTYLVWNGLSLSSPTLNSLNDRQIFIGQVDWLGDDTTKEIQNVRFVVNNRTVGTGTTMSLYLADLDTASNSPIPRDDEITDQYYDYAALSGITQYTDNVSPNLNTTRTVTKGEVVCVVFKFSTFGASTSINISPLSSFNSDGPALPTYTYYDGTTYTNQTNTPIIGFVFSDGTTGYFQGTYFTAYGGAYYTGTSKYNIDTTGSTFPLTGNERGMQWIPSAPVSITGATFLHNADTSGSNAEFRAYKNDVLIWSSSILWTQVKTTGSSNSAYRYYDMLITPSIVTVPGDVLKFTTLAIGTGSIVVPLARFTGVYSGSDMAYATNSQSIETVTRFMSGSVSSSWTGSAQNSLALYHFPQIFPRGVYLTPQEILSGSYKLSGSVTLNSTPTENVTVRAIRQSDNTVISTSSNASGYYQFGNIASGSYHVVVEYTSGSQKYNALSSWDVGAV